MNRPLVRLGALLGALAAASGLAAQTADVPPPGRREPVVELAQRLAAPPTRAPLPEQLRNPFAPSVAVVPGSGPVAAAASESDRELLQRLAPLVNPSGIVHLGGEAMLLFGQKRVKTGDALPVTFDGNPYILVISAIDRTSFTLRLNGEEITRPIKPANRP